MLAAHRSSFFSSLALMEFLKQCLRENHAIIHFYVVETAFFALFATHAIQSHNESFLSVPLHEYESRQRERTREKKAGNRRGRSQTIASKDTTVTMLMIMYWQSFHVSYIFVLLYRRQTESQLFICSAYYHPSQNWCGIISVNHEKVRAKERKKRHTATQ